MVTSSPLYFVFHSKDNTSFSFLNTLGGFIAIAGFIHNWQAEKQLQKFREENKKEGEMLKLGWWKKSRHPNMFFEVAIWVGIALIGVTDDPNTLNAFIGPAVLFIIFYFVVIPLSESNMLKTKKEFPAYKEQTNKFWPY